MLCEFELAETIKLDEVGSFELSKENYKIGIAYNKDESINGKGFNPPHGKRGSSAEKLDILSTFEANPVQHNDEEGAEKPVGGGVRGIMATDSLLMYLGQWSVLMIFYKYL